VESTDLLSLPGNADRISRLTVRIEGDMVESLNTIGTGEQSEVQPVALVDQEFGKAWTGELHRQGSVDVDLTLVVKLRVVDALLPLRKRLDPCYVNLAVSIHGEGNGLFYVALTEQ
jgi:hypothetical protein